MTQENEFQQPVLDPVKPADGEVLPGSAVVEQATNNDKTDELSLAVAAEAQRNPIHIAEVKPLPPKYQLDYVMEGRKYSEGHATLDAALASVRRLRILGIVPATSTI